MSDKEKIEDLDMRYRLALELLVLYTNKNLDYFTETIDKTMGKEYWNFPKGEDK